MHNIHYARIYAGSPEDACGMAKSQIEDFGDENNWRRIIGCVDKAGNQYHTSDDDSRWELPKSWQEIEQWLIGTNIPS